MTNRLKAKHKSIPRDCLRAAKEIKGDGTVPFWSADLTSTNSEKTYYAADREHNGAYDYEKNAVEKEGL
jgi:uncharacterized membrane protein